METVCENCDNSKDFIGDCDTLICNRCFCEIIQYKYYNFDGYQPKFYQHDNALEYFLKLVREYEIKCCVYVPQEILVRDFNLFRKAFYEIADDDKRKSLITNQAVYCILRKNGIQCKLDDFRKAKCKTNTNLSVRILEHLGWENYFSEYNKMEDVTKMINEFLESLRPINSVLASKFEDVFRKYSSDTCDPLENTCVFKIKRGENKGKLCGKKSKSNFCIKHAKRMMKDEVELKETDQ